MTKAIVLFSFGLDSLLATKLILDQGIELEAVHFLNVFSSQKEDTSVLIESFVKNLGIKIKVLELDKEFLDMVRSPKYGYGSNMNPCIDCRIFMLRKAANYMRETGASFLVTGEVLDERPMSQRREVFKIIDRESGLEGLVLRPLSAKLLEPTIPEREGWVEREKLLSIRGRSRKIQISLAREFYIKDYLWPSGGCLLTDPAFSKRIRDLFQYRSVPTLNDIRLIKIGRYFKINDSARLIVGRNRQENEKILNLILEDDHLFYPLERNGPVAIARGNLNGELINLCAGIVARYCDKENTFESLKIAHKMGFSSEEIEIIDILPLPHLKIKNLQI